MPKIHAVSTYNPPFTLVQTQAEHFVRTLFSKKITQLERYLRVFENGEILNRHLTMPIDWYKQDHDFAERNRLYIEYAVSFGVTAIERCLEKAGGVSTKDIDAIVFISSTGISTPSIDARIMNKLPFSEHVVRIPIWGLGCGGGAAGISRANDYCIAHPASKVLVLCVELCSLTFQANDLTKSNLIGTSLFGDGVACALVCGDAVMASSRQPLPAIKATASKWLPNSEDVMGWAVENTGFHVIFAKSIPSVIENWLAPFVEEFLKANKIGLSNINHFVAHPGGKKVLAAYETALRIDSQLLIPSKTVLQDHGNMSSPTVLYVLEKTMTEYANKGDVGLMAALGPGFSGELLLLEWK
ncbi:3-oxoacyl-[acyl-carrier-protein] synthase III C-terminal domain-containing protein [Viridibacillus sp. FSL R5-0477]|uniref:Chalcone synthase n=1 Tax=Viridibacillus arenosi FSL R5-213 TaxID=1227360 RepID=W4EQ20_9BACL|nr:MULTISPECIES: 3-oxoacyl-[acyl-carrier-protein] synthase III C-terminal domain-containing protein [Viridibacillus]ETT82683.1 chalcone synthase [Viridibacillus arenosi FSL R5-213]OMC82341.1 type III polyketide synthase [Viridibacillus sp. FSL H7-0596]OMC85641.1 type III polyketide synthase [Viridibacillus sp. FSL H8-0123]OMC92244.1 type III polyketide synthase [Viridibacillus arenosi]